MAALTNPRYEIFAQALADGFDTGIAYQKAGYKAHRANCVRLAQNESIRVRVAEIVSQRLAGESEAADKVIAKSGITKEKVLSDLLALASFEMSQVVEWGDAIAVPDDDGKMHMVQGVRLKSRSEIPANVLAGIAEIKIKNGQVVSIKGPDRQAAIMGIAKLMGMVVDKSEVGSPGQFTNMTDEELMRESAALDRQLAVRPDGEPLN